MLNTVIYGRYKPGNKFIAITKNILHSLSIQVKSLRRV